MTRRGILLGSTGAVLLLAASVAVGVGLYRDGIAAKVDAEAHNAVADAEDVPDEMTRQVEPIYYTFDKPFVTNMRASTAMLQASVSISSHYAQTIDDVKNDAPALRSAILLALSNLPEDTANDEATKRQLEATVAAAVNRQLKADGYGGNVDAAYFTDFLVQGNNEED